jgi:hypothetical protein
MSRNGSFCRSDNNGSSHASPPPSLSVFHLDLTALMMDAQHLDLLIKVHDAVERGEMPLKKKKQPAKAEKAAFVKELEAKLMAMTAPAAGGRFRLRRLTRMA